MSGLYVTPDMFVAHPTYLDLGNLRSGNSQQANQTAELGNILQMACAQADSYCQQPLGAHTKTDHVTMRTDRRGRLSIPAKHNPVRAVTALSYGTSIGTMTTVTNPPYRIEEGDRQMVVELAGGNAAWSGSLQFGPPVGWDLYVDVTYVAGFANTALAQSVQVGVTSIQVADPLGIYPGDTLRLWDPGAEEAVTVTAGYVPGSTTIPLAAPTVGAHAATAPVTAVPPDAILAVVYIGIDMLQRPGTASATWPGAKMPAASGKKDEPNSLYYQRAESLLRSFRAVR